MARTRESLYAAIDVGTTKVCCLVARVMAPSGNLEVVALGHAPSQGMKKGMVVSIEELEEPVRHAVAEAQSMLNRPLPPVYVGITGNHLTCLNARASLPQVSGKGQVISQRDVDRLIQSTFPSAVGQRQVVHLIPRSYQVNGLSGVRNPVGLWGDQLSAESHVVVGDTASMENVARVVHAAGAKVKGLVIENLASSEAVLTTDERETGVVLVDIGGGTSDIAIFKDGAIWHTAVLPVGGYQFTNDISLGLGISFDAAEEAKVWYGSALVDGVSPTETLEVRTGQQPETKTIQRLALSTLLHDRAVELVQLIMHKVREAGLDRIPPAGMVLTGGASNLPGLLEIARDYASCPVRLGPPSRALGLPQELENAAFATGVGLLLWGIRNRYPQPRQRRVVLSVAVARHLRRWISRFGFRRLREVKA